ncbi:putative ribonuclease H-like domain-containing protein [Tanacetum coccineum]
MCDKKNSVLFTDTECVVLSPDFKLTDESHVLLKVPRKDNMYSVDLKNVVPQGGLTCLFAKATPDESDLWHRRLGHVNFKTMNKLVKGNLVRGLPSKLFEINQTCVAYQKGMQHRSSCRKPALNFMRPFGCPVTILNTIDHLGSGPNWLFDIDALTKSMNYKPVVAGNQSNGSTVIPFKDQPFSFSKEDSPDAGFQHHQEYQTIKTFPNYCLHVSLITRRAQEGNPRHLKDPRLTEAMQRGCFFKSLTGKSYMFDNHQDVKDPNFLETELQEREKDQDKDFVYQKRQRSTKIGAFGNPKDFIQVDLVAYTDSDYAGASLDRKSTTGGCQFLVCRLISWQCKKQTMDANSTTEAEYIAASNCS